MQYFINSVRQANRERNYNAALALALTLPDIAGKIESPLEPGSAARYSAWYNRYVAAKYPTVEPVKSYFGKPTFLSGNDCYALRCAYLHEGSDEISIQRKQEVIHQFFFSTQPGIHRNMQTRLPQGTDESQIEDMIPVPSEYTTLQLNVTDFCDEICVGIEEWLNAISGDPIKMDKVNTRMKVN